MILQNAKVYTEEKAFRDGTIYVQGGTFSAAPADGPVLDAGGATPSRG